MGLLDQIEGFAGQKLHSLLGGTRFGGMDGLLQHLSQSGLSGEVASWKDPNQSNQPVNPDQLHQALGGEVEKIAASLGVPPQAATALLAKILPQAAAQHSEAEGGSVH
jgi:uncharacterized protein YidB (DUF937 family)